MCWCRFELCTFTLPSAELHSQQASQSVSQLASQTAKCCYSAKQKTQLLWCVVALAFFVLLFRRCCFYVLLPSTFRVFVIHSFAMTIRGHISRLFNASGCLCVCVWVCEWACERTARVCIAKWQIPMNICSYVGECICVAMYPWVWIWE